jgi:hypothetical protein
MKRCVCLTTQPQKKPAKPAKHYLHHSPHLLISYPTMDETGKLVAVIGDEVGIILPIKIII